MHYNQCGNFRDKIEFPDIFFLLVVNSSWKYVFFVNNSRKLADNIIEELGIRTSAVFWPTLYKLFCEVNYVGQNKKK